MTLIDKFRLKNLFANGRKGSKNCKKWKLFICLSKLIWRKGSVFFEILKKISWVIKS